MSDVSVSISVPAGLKALGDIVAQAAADAKAGKSAAQILVDIEAPFVAALGLIGELGTDVKDAQVYTWGGYFVGQLANALVPAPVPAPAA